MELVKVGKKLISKEKLEQLILRILHLRSSGSTQQEVAHELGIERSFISHLEGLGEIVETGNSAVVAIGVPETAGLSETAHSAGFEKVYFPGGSGSEDAAGMLKLIAHLNGYDRLIFVAPVRLIEAAKDIFGPKVRAYPVGDGTRGASWINLADFKEFLTVEAGKKNWGKLDERNSKYKLGLFQKKSYR